MTRMSRAEQWKGWHARFLLLRCNCSTLACSPLALATAAVMTGAMSPSLAETSSTQLRACPKVLCSSMHLAPLSSFSNILTRCFTARRCASKHALASNCRLRLRLRVAGGGAAAATTESPTDATLKQQRSALGPHPLRKKARALRRPVSAAHRTLFWLEQNGYGNSHSDCSEGDCNCHQRPNK